MRSPLLTSCKVALCFRIGFVAILTFALSGWTCTAVSCLGISSTPQISALSPNPISANAQSVVLMVTGDNFVPQSQILWNGHMLATAFMNGQHLQATITQQTFEQFGGLQGSNVLVTVNSPTSTRLAGCPVGGNSSTLVLVIN